MTEYIVKELEILWLFNRNFFNGKQTASAKALKFVSFQFVFVFFSLSLSIFTIPSYSLFLRFLVQKYQKTERIYFQSLRSYQHLTKEKVKYRKRGSTQKNEKCEMRNLQRSFRQTSASGIRRSAVTNFTTDFVRFQSLCWTTIKS